MKPLLTTLIIILFALPALCQSKTTSSFSEKNKNVFTLFFYNNTLKMLNKEGDEDFARLIEDIDKMKFIRVNKKENKITKTVLKQLINDYHDEDFEDLMTVRQDGMNIRVYIKEDDGVTTGLVLLMDELENLMILDIKGKVPLNHLAKLISKVTNMD